MSYDEATNSPEHAFWKPAIESELSSLEKNNMWPLVSRENAQNILKSSRLFKVKDVVNGDKSVTEKKKARFVLREFEQVQGVDFSETYAPIVKFTSAQAVLLLSACLDLELQQVDVVTAFLNRDLDEDIYMEVLQGIAFDKGKDLVRMFNKGLYGLKQAARQWNAKN